MHSIRKANSIKAHNNGIHFPPPNSKQICITVDKSSNFQLLNDQLKGSTKDLSFFNFLVRFPEIIETPSLSEDESDWVDIDATKKTQKKTSDQKKKKKKFYGPMTCYLYFFKNEHEFSHAEVVLQLQADLTSKLNQSHPEYTLTFIADGCKSECNLSSYFFFMRVMFFFSKRGPGFSSEKIIISTDL